MTDDNLTLITRNGLKFWQFPDGTSFRAISGGDGSSEDDGDGDEGENESKAKGPSQSQIDRAAARARSEGKRVARTELLQELGFGSAEEATAAIQALRDAEAERLSDADRRLQEAEDKERKLAQRETELNARLVAANVERALEQAGVPVAQSPKVAKLVEGVDAESGEDDIAAAVEALKEDMPHLFAVQSDVENEDDGSEDEDETPRPKGIVPKPPRAKAPVTDTSKEAQDLLRQRHPHLTQQS